MEKINAVSNFSFWCPLETISKATDANGGEIMRLGGIASTIDEDSDGEYLDPKGFDIKPLLEKGLVNWHHQAKSNPGTIVGEPTKAEIRKEGLYIETDLYPSSPIARDIWELAQTLEKDSKTRRLGYSIEGKVVKRKSNDKNNPDYKRIEKAIITGVAITHMPKNPKTFANIIKGEIDDEEIEDEEKKEKDPQEIEKEGVEAETKTAEKDSEGTNTDTARPLIKEDVDDKLKVQTFGKAETLERLFKDIPGIEIEKAIKIFDLINNIAMAKNTSITEDDIQKAYDTLGLTTPDYFSKGDDEDDQKPNEEVEETEETKTEEEEEDAKDKTEETEEVDDEEEEEETSKAEILSRFERIEKAMATSYSGSIKYFKALGALLKDTNEKFEKALDDLEIANNNIAELSEMNKAQTDIINDLTAQLEAFGNTTPAPKSLRNSAPVERFAKGETETAPMGANQVSIRNRQLISEILDQATFAKGYDEEFSKACTSYEASRSLPANIRDRIQREFGIQIID